MSPKTICCCVRTFEKLHDQQKFSARNGLLGFVFEADVAAIEAFTPISLQSALLLGPQKIITERNTLKAMIDFKSIQFSTIKSII